jgi:amino acid adenylation domain-containing protein
VNEMTAAKLELGLEPSIKEWNNTRTDYEHDRSIIDLFEQQVDRRPDARALLFGETVLTYRELDARANRLAHKLRSLGIGRNSLVGIAMHRCPELIISLLGVLKAGGAYLAIDPSYPRERLAGMVTEIRLSALLTSTETRPLLPDPGAPILCLDAETEALARESDQRLPRESHMDDLVYVIFTSGSTGRPKGAAVHSRGWTNLLQWFVKHYKINQNDRVLIVSSFSFDITQRAIAMPLIVGGELHLLNSQVFDPELIRRTLTASRITLMNLAPSTFYPVVEVVGDESPPYFPELRTVFLGGEAISASRLRAFSETGNTELANVYGAAECSDVSSAYTLKNFDRYIKETVPIGRPISNTQILLLDENLAPVKRGEVGEICITGDGVGKGYINDPELTTRKFVRDPFSPTGLLYRTGDLGRLGQDGELEFHGRVDHQIKLRGWRIDVGDVETALRQDEHVRDAVVVKRSFGEDDERLVAFVVLKHGVTPSWELAGDLKRAARHRLPEQMVPSVFEMVPELPLNPNGKVDRGVLLTVELKPAESARIVEAPKTPLEARVAEVFARVLKVDTVDRNDNFFDLGGYSSLLTEALAYINDEFSAEINVYEFLLAPTVSALAERIERGPQER